MALQLTRTYPHPITVDDTLIHLTIKRMSPAEFAVFEAQFLAYKDQKPAAPNPDAVSLSTAETAALEANVAWLRAAFAAYVSVALGDLRIDEDDITDGAAFFDAMCVYPVVLQDVLAALYLEQCLTPAQKKTWKSRRDSSTGSSAAPAVAIPGETPARAASSAARAASVPAAAVTRRPHGPSGMTADSSSTTAPSATPRPRRGRSSRSLSAATSRASSGPVS